MTSVEIKAQKRENTKKAASKQYRKSGLIPAVVYGQGTNKNILINNKDFVKLTTLTKSTIINLVIDGGEKTDVLIKDYQKDHLRDRYMHIDFYELKAGKPVHVKIRLNFLGNPAGVRDGGVLEKHMLELPVECLPKDIIPSIDVNINDLNKNESLHVRDIKMDEKYKILAHPDDVLAHISGKLATEEEPVKQQAEAAAVGTEEEAAAATAPGDAKADSKKAETKKEETK